MTAFPTTLMESCFLPASPGRLRLLPLLLLGLVALCASSAAHAQTVSREYRIKAGFIYNFTKFVEWPADRFDDANSPIVIAVLGDNPFGDTLATAVKDRLVNNRPIQVRLIKSADEIYDAHIVYVTSGEEARLLSMPAALHGVLTVGESAEFANVGGIIRFTLVDEKVRFEINQHSGEQAGLKLSAQLLKLATTVRTKS